MSNSVTQKPAIQLDGFAGYTYTPPTITSGGGAEGSSGRALADLKLKFTNEARWIDQEGADVRARQIVFDLVRRVQKWPGDGGAPLETITLKPNEPWPDIAALNENCRDEWYEKFGKMVGPWAGEHVVLLFNPDNILLRY